MEDILGRDALEAYFRGRVGECRLMGLKKLGSGAHGTGFLVELETGRGEESFVLKSVAPDGLGHDYPSDRAAMMLMALDTFGGLKGHVKALDVLALGADGVLRAIGGGTEYYLLMERGAGVSYFDDLRGFSKKAALGERDRERISVMAEYLAEVHSARKDSRTLYLRKLRDIIGHGECLMGVFDSYPDGVMSFEEMARIEKKCVDWRARLKGRYRRLSRIHGDFHPGNIWFSRDEGGPEGRPSICLLDRSRGPWGEAADDVTALTINYLFFSVKDRGAFAGPYLEAFKLFFEEYLRLTADEEILEVLAPFYAFRGAVVANPVFYPELDPGQRRLIFAFVKRVLGARRFHPERAERYLRA